MRLLIYLLAMMTGFSAAEAARPLAAAPAAVAQGAVVVGSIALVEQETMAQPQEYQPVAASIPSLAVRTVFAVAASSPVSRNDLSRQ